MTDVETPRQTHADRMAALRDAPPGSTGLHNTVAVEHITNCGCDRCDDRESEMTGYWNADDAFQDGLTDVEPEHPSEVYDHYCDTCQDPAVVDRHGGDVTHTALGKDCRAVRALTEEDQP